ncbi:GmrSD restriction endonuclease domain-containing protein [Sphingomonas sp. DC1200-1]|uniref:GmrSD restriction endonuclease domain-containing protein n=1 Tax=Sphingomonas sp. DC1200-1 TaxID=2804660 RepID=UPI003CEC6CB7
MRKPIFERTEDEIVSLLHYSYGEAYTYSVLAFLYPTLDFRNKFHQDHIFPKKMFTKKRLSKAGISEEDAEFFMDNFNSLANLQLLEGVPNQEKSGKDFDAWLTEKYPSAAERKDYMAKHYIPDVDLSFAHFREFIGKRENMLVKAFKELLN